MPSYSVEAEQDKPRAVYTWRIDAKDDRQANQDAHCRALRLALRNVKVWRLRRNGNVEQRVR